MRIESYCTESSAKRLIPSHCCVYVSRLQTLTPLETRSNSKRIDSQNKQRYFFEISGDLKSGSRIGKEFVQNLYGRRASVDVPQYSTSCRTFTFFLSASSFYLSILNVFLVRHLLVKAVKLYDTKANIEAIAVTLSQQANQFH